MQISPSVIPNSTASTSSAPPRNYTVDAFRILGAFCVVALHSPLGTLPNIAALSIRLCSRWAVPYFFLVSGYFLGLSLVGKPNAGFSKSLNSLLGIFIITNLVYCGFYLLDNNPATHTELTFVGLLIGQAGHLWYIGSLIFGLLIVQYVVSKYSDRTLFFLGLGVFVLLLACDGYSRLTGISMEREVVRYLTSVPFLAAGFLIARHQNILRRLSVKTCVAMVLLGLVLEYSEAIGLYKLAKASPHNQELLIGTAVLALGLFCLSLVFTTPHPTNLSRAGKSYSLLIYLYHPIIISLLYNIFSLASYSSYLYWVSPIVCFFATLFVIKSIEKISPAAFKVLSGV